MERLAKSPRLNGPVDVPSAVIATTLSALKSAGARGTEGMVTWLGRRRLDGTELIEDVYAPRVEATDDFFWIDEGSMQDLMNRLRRSRQMIVAQVHSHPNLAFHSAADDRWAIVRHWGALSLVLPFFARNTTASNFVHEAAVFVLDSHNAWVECRPEEIYRIV